MWYESWHQSLKNHWVNSVEQIQVSGCGPIIYQFNKTGDVYIYIMAQMFHVKKTT